MYCPDCGSDAGEAKFCPECGADLSAVRGAVRGKGGAKGGVKGGAKAGAKFAGDAGAPVPPPPSRRGPAPLLIWGGVAVVAVVAVFAVLFWPGEADDGTATDGGSAGNGAVTAVEADTSGSYDELVQRANDLFDQGDALFQQDQIDQGARYFAAAAEVYAAAWKKQPGDPNVGTDWATALFYSGDMEGAVKRVDVVLKADPGFQTAWFNKGNFLAHEARLAKMGGEDKDSAELFERARQAYLKAVALDPDSDVGKEADRRLQSLED